MNDAKLRTAIEQVSNATDIPTETKDKIAATLKEARDAVPDTFVYRIVVMSLGTVTVLTVLGSIVLSAMSSQALQHPLPEGVIALASAAVGALAGLLAPSPRA